MSKKCPCLTSSNHPAVQVSGGPAETRVCSCSDCGRILWDSAAPTASAPAETVVQPPWRPAVDTAESDDEPDESVDESVDDSEQILADFRKADANRRRQPAPAAVVEQSAIEEFDERVSALMATGKTKPQAVRQVVVSDSDLHKRYLAEVNRR